MWAFGFAMKLNEYLTWQVPTLTLFAVLFALSTAFLRSTMCIEGGTVIGYPWYIFPPVLAIIFGGFRVVALSHGWRLWRRSYGPRA